MNTKVALVTAATRGIGWEAACKLAQKGIHVYVASTENEIKNAEDKIRKCNAEGLKISTVEYDAFQTDTYQPMIDAIISRENKIDILVNNFGYTDMAKDVTIDKIKYEDFERLCNLNIRSVMIPTQLVLPFMQKEGGSIVNVASIAGKVPDLSEMAYGTAKAAICHISKMVAVQQAKYKIRCNAVLPGIVATDSVKSALPEEYQQFFLRHVPMGRMAEPDEIGDAITFLATNAYVTGQLLEITGGFGTATPLYADMTSPLSK